MPHIRDLTPTVSYLMGVPVPYSSIGFHCPNLLPPSPSDRVVDNVEQIGRFYRHYRRTKPSSPSIPHRSSSYEEGYEYSREVQHVVDNTHIRYSWCVLGLVLMVGGMSVVFARSVALSTDALKSVAPNTEVLKSAASNPDALKSVDRITDALKSGASQATHSLTSVGCVLCLVLYCSCFTSYTLITHPSFYPLFFALFTAVLLSSTTPATTLGLVFLPMLFTPSPPLLCFLCLLCLPLLCSTTLLQYALALLQDLSAVFYFLQPVDTPHAFPAVLCLVIALALHGTTPSLSLSSFALFVVVLNGFSSASVVLSLLLSCAGLQQLPKQSMLSPLLVVEVALYYTYLTTPSFSFTSIRWAPAFVVTHASHFVVQGFCVVCSIFYPFIAVTRMWRRESLWFFQMLAVVVAAVSVLYNTASPVVWSVFTPLLLFLCVLWFVVVLCSCVCSSRLTVFFMDLSGIPSEYFDTKSYFRQQDKKLRKKGYVVDRYGRPIKKRRIKKNISVSRTACYAATMLLIFLWIVLFLLVYLDVVTWGKQRVCPPGFDYGECERTDFLDSYIWKPMRTYSVNGVDCKYGVAFRIWSPVVDKVEVSITDYVKTTDYDMKLAFLGERNE